MTLVVFTIVLAVLVLVAGGVIVYLLKNPVKESTTIQNPLNTPNNMSSNGNKVEQVKEMTADERFDLYAKGLKNSLSQFYEFGEVFDGEKYKCKIPTDYDLYDNWLGIEDVIINYNGDLHLKLNSNSDLGKKYGTNYKLATNVIKAGAMMMGQDASVLIYAINDSGEFLCYRVEQNANNDLKLKSISKLKNIVEIQRYSNGETSMLLVAIDIDGKIYNIKDYI